MNNIEKVANILGVNLYEEFTIKPTLTGGILGCKINEKAVYRFDTSLVYKGYDDGWSEWYGFGCADTLYKLLLGLLEIVKIN